eukprot:12498436-Heterocapsa_arctica.AAC.1
MKTIARIWDAKGRLALANRPAGCWLGSSRGGSNAITQASAVDRTSQPPSRTPGRPSTYRTHTAAQRPCA